jgi:hypothetical protein
MLGIKKYSPPRSTLNVWIPRMRRLTGSFERRPFLLPSDDRVTLFAGADEIVVIDPLLLQEFHRGHRLGADEQEDSAAWHCVILVGQRAWIVRFSVCRPAPYEPVDIHVGEPCELCVPWVHAPDMGSERHLPAMRVVRVIEVTVALRVGAELWVIDVRSERQRGSTAPAADQLRSKQLAFFLGVSIRPKESIERTYTRLIFAEAYIGAVTAEDIGLRDRDGNSGLPRISKNELACLDRPSLARQRLPSIAGWSMPSL